MRALRYFGIYFVYPVLLLGTGFLGGMMFMNYFYPGNAGSGIEQFAVPEESIAVPEELMAEQEDNVVTNSVGQGESGDGWQRVSGEITHGEEKSDNQAMQSSDSAEVIFREEVLNADTAYVLEETDLRNDSVVETTWKLPAKYIGMNREEFLEAMEIYEASPPLEELERGFVSLEVLSFSVGKVVVQMNYEYVQPGSSFYLTVEDNYVVVYLEDRKTVYMDTDILLKDLPEELQNDIIQTMFVPDEESLYDFLENYSS